MENGILPRIFYLKITVNNFNIMRTIQIHGYTALYAKLGKGGTATVYLAIAGTIWTTRIATKVMAPHLAAELRFAS